MNTLAYLSYYTSQISYDRTEESRTNLRRAMSDEEIMNSEELERDMSLYLATLKSKRAQERLRASLSVSCSRPRVRGFNSDIS